MKQVRRYDGTRRTRRRAMLGAAALAALVLAAVGQTSTSMADATHTDSASKTAVAGACTIDAGAVTAAGDHRSQIFSSTSPIVRDSNVIRGKAVYKPGQVRLSTEMRVISDRNWYSATGHVVIGSTLYRSNYGVFENEPGPNTATLRRVGGGWGDFTAITASERSSADPNGIERLYGLRKDGTLFRWIVESEEGSAPIYHGSSTTGFAAVKTMTLLSRTSTYDTLLMTTRGGALYTVRVPVTSPMKPVVKQVRSSTWQVFETLIGERCGNYGTLLLGIDKNTKTGFLYAVGHANGSATVIRGLGKVPGTFGDALDFRWSQYDDAPLFGE